MSIREEILQAASSAPSQLRDARERVVDFVRGRLVGDGGFAGRSDRSDLYYTVFGIECLLALGAELPADGLAEYLGKFGDGESLDLVHLACLARCWADLPRRDPGEDVRAGILRRLQELRCADGGFSHVGGGRHGSTYGSFLAVGAYQDLGADLPEAEALADCIESLELGDGAYANDPRLGIGSTAATAAGVTALRHLGRQIDRASTDWLLGRHGLHGGFLAATGMLTPDLLSTAIALHALAGAGVELDELRRPCLDFLDGLWDGAGAFRGCAADDALDCEYTFYGLLVLGHLSE